MFQKANIVILTTNQKTTLIGLYKDTHKLVFNNPNNKDISRGIPQHLYTTSDEEIKEGDWCIQTNYEKTLSNICKYIDYGKGSFTFKKIIASTDSLLGKYINGNNSLYGEFIGVNLPQPSQLFIDKYIIEYNKGNTITEIMVEYEENYKDVKNYGIRGEHLKINSKDNTITIRRIKDSWTRDEVKQLISLAWATASAYGEYTNGADCKDWINHNL